MRAPVGWLGELWLAVARMVDWMMKSVGLAVMVTGGPVQASVVSFGRALTEEVGAQLIAKTVAVELAVTMEATTVEKKLLFGSDWAALTRPPKKMEVVEVVCAEIGLVRERMVMRGSILTD